MKKKTKQPILYLNYDNPLPNVDVVANAFGNTLEPGPVVTAPRIKTPAERELEELKDPLGMPTFEEFMKQFFESRGIKFPMLGRTRFISALDCGKSIKKCDDGDDYIDYTHKPADTSWHTHWFEGRQKQMQQNLDAAGISRTAKEETQRQLNTLGDIIESYPSRTTPAAAVAGGFTESTYHPTTGQRLPFHIQYTTPNPSPGIEAHERTHGLDAKPQEDVLDVLDQQLRPEWDTKPDSYRNDPGEKYAHLMQARRDLNLDPSYIVTPEDVKRWRNAGPDAPYWQALQFFDTLDDAGLARIFNEIASANTTPSNIAYADLGLNPRKSIKPARRK